MKEFKPYSILFGLFILLLFLFISTPKGMTTEAKHTLGITLFMSILWITQAVSIYITAFIPLAIFPLFGILSAEETAKNYGHNFVILLMGGLMLAKSIEKQNLHKRIALSFISLLGTNKKKIIFSFMLISALLSMWIANVAVTLLMLPIALAISERTIKRKTNSSSNFSVALFLGIAYCASIGGSSNIVGTPPNMVFAGTLKNFFPNSPEIDFFYWLKIGIPILVILLPICWFYLIKYFKIKGHLRGGKAIIDQEKKSLGVMSSGEKKVLIIFVLTALGWIFRRDIQINHFIIPGWSNLLGNSKLFIHDSTVAILGILLLFFIPNNSGNKKEALLDWKTTSTIPWGVLFIVGSGYALSSGFKSTGLSQWIGNELYFIKHMGSFFMLFFILSLTIFITEINSNTATANIFMPILASLAISAEINPLIIMIPATFACSFSFMLPSGSGTNSVVFASEKVSLQQMAKCGFWLNIICIFSLSLIFYFLIFPMLGINLDLPSWTITK